MTLLKMKEKERIKWVDTAKGLGLFLVIIGHLHVPYLTAWIYFFHMPLFFFLSGVVFSGEKYGFKEFLVRKIKSLVVPYFSLGIVIWLFYVIINSVVGQDKALYGTNLAMIKKLLIQEHFWTIWFLACLFLTEILYYAIEKLLHNRFYGLSILSVLVCVLGLSRYRLGLGSLPWNIDVALIAQVFYHGGFLLKKSKKMQKFIFANNQGIHCIKVMVLLIINIFCGCGSIKIANESLDMSVGLYGNEILTLVSAFAGIVAVIMISDRISNKFIVYLGRNTMILFAWHSRIIIVFCNYIYEWLGIFQGESILLRFAYASVTLLVILGILIPVTEIIKKSKLHWIFGV